MSAEARLIVVREFIEALRCGDRAAAKACLSPDFGISSSERADDFLTWELSQFHPRRYLLERGYSVEFDRIVEPSTFYSILDSRGWLLYEDEFFFDDQDRIIGNQRMFDVVTKLHFVAGDVFRGICLPRFFVRHARILNQNLLWSFVKDSSAEGSTIIKYAVSGDDFVSRNIDLRIIGESFAQTVHVSARGMDSKHFVDNMFCGIDGFRVMVPVDRMNIWCISVMLEGGEWVVVEHPSKSVYEFDAKVQKVVLTDALDHDWESACHE